MFNHMMLLSVDEGLSFVDVGEFQMLLRTHKRIARRIAEELKLTPTEALRLEKGCIRPDYWKNYPHHYGKKKQISKHILDARRLFLENDKLDSLFWLGVALHYVQDHWVTVPSSSFDHGWWEDQIEEAPFVDDNFELLKEFDLAKFYPPAQTIQARVAQQRYIETNQRLLEFRKLCLSNFEDCTGRLVESATLNVAMIKHPMFGAPIFDFNFASKVSLLIALSVYQSTTSSRLQKELMQMRKEFEIRLQEAEKALAKKLVELNTKRTELEQNRGFINWVRKLACSLNIRVNHGRYENRSHLLTVREAYYKEAEWKSNAFRNWYVAFIPKLDIEKIDRLIK
jgi:hypothetical protein